MSVDPETVAVLNNGVQGKRGEYVTRTGSRLKLRPVAQSLILQISDRVREPAVPKWFNEDKGREEENPLDPAYLRAVDEYKIKLHRVSMDIYIAMGIGEVELGPDVPALDSQEWSDILNVIGFDVPSSGPARRLVWLRDIVLAGDTLDVFRAIALYSGGTTEEEVAKAMESFRSGETRPSDNGVQSSQEV